MPEPRRPARRAPRRRPPGGWIGAGLLAGLPALLGIAAEIAAHTGTLGDPRVGVQGSALRSDWLLAAGLALSLLAGVVVAGAWERQRHRRQVVVDQAEAAAADRRLLLSRLDHELKNPLTAMRAAVANAAAAEPGADLHTALGSIGEQLLRLSRLTADLRKIAEVQTGSLDSEPVDVSALLTEAVEVVGEQPDAAGRDIRLDLPRAPWPLPPVRGDYDLLSLAVVNLVDNAVKYTPTGGTVEVRARETAGSVLIEVADTGAGIDPTDLPHVWEELYRSPRARRVPGSGLGLPLVRAVVERHGGTVAADSRLGAGTAVRLRLPAATPEA
ncbi:sensor histidine kinase [Modestobacter roseus]|uniref:Sensor-like histidine kinase SenX3 n=1 Tax=Modestobacter roseus TaxID=1181884 RepID=A0A562IVU3_9ACTN|nr:HAMP domain-containing sensor histidine kinase [Modestobacter roseus]MQA34708.1 sensor histidine kinase [Modestobacter roseus]TWH75129.1 phospho-acceptor domain-containing protein [Modestobacter roseus]